MNREKYTPDLITALGPDEVFVFGSNALGHHGGGAALQAFERFGAEWGMGAVSYTHLTLPTTPYV